MKNRNVLLGFVVTVILVAGIVWWMKQAPTEKPVSAAAPAKLAAQLAMTVAPRKAEVVAPTAPAVVPSASSKSAETPVATTNADADLNTAVSNLITTLQTGDVKTFVQSLAPSIMEMAKTSAEARISKNPNANFTPEMKAQMEQMMEQRMPMMIEQMTQRLSQRPDIMQVYQKMATALQSAQATPPQMNEAGDRATYNLQTNGDKGIPASVFFVRQDGKWTLDFMSMVQSMAPSGN